MLRHVYLELITAITLLTTAATARASEPVPPTLIEQPSAPVEGSLNLDGAALWDGLHDLSVTIALKNGKRLSGTVVTHDREKIALARLSDGTIVAVPKAQIQAVQVLGAGAIAEATLPPRESRPTVDGRRGHIAGGTMVGLGAPLSLVGIGLSPTLGIYIGLPTLFAGIGLIVGGSVMMNVAKQRNAAFRKGWGISKLQISPILNAGREGGQLGVAMRF